MVGRLGAVTAVATLITLFVGRGLATSVVVVVIVSFFPIMVNMMRGLLSADVCASELLHVYGASRWQHIRYVQGPYALPFLFAGLRVACASSGLGVLLIDGERVACIGSRRDVEANAAKLPRVDVIDLRSHCVIPGLIDMHAHLDREGLKRRHLAMSGLRSRRDVLDRIGTLAGSMEQGAWLVTAPLGEPPFYFFDDPGHESDLYPTRWELDEVAPDRPVYIRPILGFWRWSPWPECLVSAANSVALDAVGLTDDTAPPTPTGELEREPPGRLTGRFFERTTASILELTHFSKAFRYENVDRLQALDVSQRLALSTATTTIFQRHP